MIEVQLQNQAVLEAMQSLLHATENLKPALLEMGEVFTESTKARFESTQAPDGSDWLLNTLATLEHKEGDRPLTGETGLLMDSIHYQLESADTLSIGSPMEYAAMQQFGGHKSEFPFLWGDIPARPFLGLSTEDEQSLLDIISGHLNLAQ